MKRVLVIGSGGAGKTTFSRRLARATGLPLVHLDRHYWRAGWTPTPASEWTEAVRAFCAAKSWIMDGNYGGTLDVRVAAADTVVFLDTPRRTCITRVLRRRVEFHGRSRPSLADDCPERLTLPFLCWIWSYPSRRRPQIVAMLASLEGAKAVHVLTSDREQESFLARVGGGLA